MDDASRLTAFFVYGTLQRGQCRQRCWPVPAQQIERAFVQGQLYDLGEYPALLPGADWVAGERWQLSAADVPRALRVLDRVEGYGQPGEADLYDRQVIPVYASPTGRSLGPAYVYVLKDLAMLAHARRLLPAAIDGRAARYAEWPDAGAP